MLYRQLMELCFPGWALEFLVRERTGFLDCGWRCVWFSRSSPSSISQRPEFLFAHWLLGSITPRLLLRRLLRFTSPFLSIPFSQDSLNQWTRKRRTLKLCAGEAGAKAGGTPFGRIELFTTESCVGEWGREASSASTARVEQAGRNENELHPRIETGS